MTTEQIEEVTDWTVSDSHRVERLTEAVQAVQAEEILVATNAGTFGASECCRVTGSGDPQFGEYQIYERVGGGAPRVVGCDPENSPGWGRVFRTELNERRRHLSHLKVAASRARRNETSN